MNSIRARLLVTLLAGLAAILLAGGMVVHALAMHAMTNQIDGELRSRAEALASLASIERGNLEFEFDHWPAEAQPGGFFEFREFDGAMLRRSANLDRAGLPTRPTGASPPCFDDVALSTGTPGRAIWLSFVPRSDADLDDDEHDVGAADQTIDDEPPVLMVVVAISREPVDRALSNSSQRCSPPAH